MFDNPQQEVKKMSKKLRPIKMSDEEFELFYKEIYAEFGPKGVPAFDPKAQVEEPVAEPVEEIVEEPVQEPVIEVVEEPVAVPVEEPVAEEEISVEIPAEPVFTPDEEEIQENTAKAAAVIRNVQEDEFFDDYDDGEVPAKKEKGVAGLVVTLCIECLAIAGVVAYWLLNIL